MALPAIRANAGKYNILKRIIVKNAPVTSPTVIQVATLYATFGDKYPYAKPWPYKTRPFKWYHDLYDTNKARLCEQSKVIVVEGNIGSGKHDFARRLAHNFDLKYVPDITEDDIFTVAENGFDVRSLNHLLGGARYYTLQDLLRDEQPDIANVGRLQLMYYAKRYENYYRALLHLFNTGQGCVVVRSAFSDSVFKEVLSNMNLVSKRFSNFYDETVLNSACMCVKPHLVVYLDTPVQTCLENMAKRGKESEKNAPLLNEKFLTNIERVYKEKFLPKSRITQEVVELDWSTPSDDMDFDVITEEISTINLEPENGCDDPKFPDWNPLTEDQCGEYRRLYADDSRMDSYTLQNIASKCPELLFDEDDAIKLRRYIYEHPLMRYGVGWSPELGKPYLRMF